VKNKEINSARDELRKDSKELEEKNNTLEYFREERIKYQLENL
jgi:hypothetical protein